MLKSILIEDKLNEIYEKRIKEKFVSLIKENGEFDSSLVEIRDKVEINENFEYCENRDYLYSFELESDFYLLMFIENNNIIYLILNENYEEYWSYEINIENIFDYL